MIKSLFFHPAVVASLWSQSVLGARQPARRGFELDRATVDGEALEVTEGRAAISPFVELTCFKRLDGPRKRKILITPPMSGAFPFLTRDMVARFAREADVWVLEWINAREIAIGLGSFDFDDQVDAIAEAIQTVGPDAHVVSLCQSGPPSLMACAALAERDRSVTPASLTLLGAPIEPTAKPCMISQSLRSHDLPWYEERLTARRVPGSRLPRMVYPAEAQLSLLYSVLSGQDYERDELSRMILRDEAEDLGGVSFLELTTSLMDLPAEHFLQNIERVYLGDESFVERLRLRGRRLDFAALSHMPMMTVEGENDQVAAVGQTAAALAGCPADLGVARREAVIEGAGHFGLFYGRKWREDAVPQITAHMEHADRMRHEPPKGASNKDPSTRDVAENGDAEEAATPEPDGDHDAKPQLRASAG